MCLLLRIIAIGVAPITLVTRVRVIKKVTFKCDKSDFPYYKELLIK